MARGRRAGLAAAAGALLVAGAAAGRPVELSLERKVQSDAMCGVCEAGLAQVDRILADPKTEAEIQAILKDKVCHNMGSMEATCNLMLPSVVPQLIAKVTSEADSVGCSFACKKSWAQQVREAFQPVQEETRELTPASFGDGTCNLCQIAVGKLHDYTSSDSFKDKATELAKQFCSKLGDSASQCKTFLPLFLPALEQKLNDFLGDGKEACSKVGACIAH